MSSPDLEVDLKASSVIIDKCKVECYAQNLYAALCNMEWQKTEVFPILKGETWGCSWRSAGGIVAEIRKEGDYMSWYCSGMGGVAVYSSEEESETHINEKKFVSEGTVTDEIRHDLKQLGWHPVPYN